MDTDLLTEARHLASRGWLPGIKDQGNVEWNPLSRRLVSSDGVYCETTKKDATEADLHLAAHRYITDPKRGWGYRFSMGITIIDSDLPEPEFYPGTTTLSLLRALRRACEEHERNEGAKR